MPKRLREQKRPDWLKRRERQRKLPRQQNSLSRKKHWLQSVQELRQQKPRRRQQRQRQPLKPSSLKHRRLSRLQRLQEKHVPSAQRLRLRHPLSSEILWLLQRIQ